MNPLHTAFEAVFSVSWRTSLVILALTVLRLAVRGRIPAQLWFVAWIVIALRLLVPLTVPAAWSPFNLGKVVSKVAAPASPLIAAVSDRVPPSTAKSFSADSPLSSGQVSAPPAPLPSEPSHLQLDLIWLWPIGAAALLTARMLVWRAFRRRLQATRQPADDRLSAAANHCGATLKMSRSPSVCETAAVDGPALFGIFRPQLLFPPGFAATLSDDELRLVVLHELGHWRRRDLLSQALIQVACALHWFNPVVWLATRLARQDCEFACDEFVIRRAPTPETQNYGAALLKVLGVISASRRPAPLLGILENRSQLKRRLQMIGGYKNPSLARALSGVVLLVFLSAVCGTRETRAQDAMPRQAAEKLYVHITIKADGSILVEKENTPLDLSEFRARLSAYAAKGQPTTVLIQADPQVRYESLLRVIAEIKKTQVGRISFAVQGEVPDSIAADTDWQAEKTARAALVQSVQTTTLTEQNRLRQKAIDDSKMVRSAPAPEPTQPYVHPAELVNDRPDPAIWLGITITADGRYFFDGASAPTGLPELLKRVQASTEQGRRTEIRITTDEDVRIETLSQLMDGLKAIDRTRFSLRTRPTASEALLAAGTGRSVKIQVNAVGLIFVDGTSIPIAMKELRAHMEDAQGQADQITRVLIENAGTALSHRTILQLLDLLREERIPDTAVTFARLETTATPDHTGIDPKATTTLEVVKGGHGKLLEEPRQGAVRYWLQELMLSCLVRDVVMVSSLKEWQQQLSSGAFIHCQYVRTATLAIPERNGTLEFDEVLLPLPENHFPDYIFIKHGQQVLCLAKYDPWVLFKLVSEAGLPLYQSLSKVDRGLF